MRRSRRRRKRPFFFGFAPCLLLFFVLSSFFLPCFHFFFFVPVRFCLSVSGLLTPQGSGGDTAPLEEEARRLFRAPLWQKLIVVVFVTAARFPGHFFRPQAHLLAREALPGGELRRVSARRQREQQQRPQQPELLFSSFSSPPAARGHRRRALGGRRGRCERGRLRREVRQARGLDALVFDKCACGSRRRSTRRRRRRRPLGGAPPLRRRSPLAGLDWNRPRPVRQTESSSCSRRGRVRGLPGRRRGRACAEDGRGKRRLRERERLFFLLFSGSGRARSEKFSFFSLFSLSLFSRLLSLLLFLTENTKQNNNNRTEKTKTKQVVLQALMRATDPETARSVEVVGARADLSTGRVAVLRTGWVSARGGALYE